MYKKTIFNLHVFLVQIGIIEQHKKNKSPRIINYEYKMIENNKFHQIDNLFEVNEEKNLKIKNYWEEDLLSQKRYCTYSNNFFS